MKIGIIHQWQGHKITIIFRDCIHLQHGVATILCRSNYTIHQDILKDENAPWCKQLFLQLKRQRFICTGLGKED